MALSPLSEKALITVAVLGASTIVIGGAWAAIAHDKPHIMNRAGSLVVCVQGLLIMVELARRLRLRLAEEKLLGNPYVLSESLRAEKQIVSIIVSLAVIGEFLHGFGDIVIDFVIWAMK